MATQQVTVLPVAIKEWRRVRGISQATLAKHAGVSDGLIAQIETGRRSPGLGSLSAIAGALDVDPQALAVIHVDLTGMADTDTDTDTDHEQVAS